MGRSGSVVVSAFILILVLSMVAGLAGCGSKSPITTTSYPVPASITLTPATYASVELGTYQTFTATVTGSNKSTVTEPVFFQSSNTAVLTIASNGDACAGSW